MNTPTQQRSSQFSANSPGSSSLSTPVGNDDFNRVGQRSSVAEERVANSRIGPGNSYSSSNDATLVAQPSSFAPPLRSGTLSWQQRPSSKGSATTRSRPLSVFVTENNALKSPRATPEPPSTNEVDLSRNQIAHSLGSKDPAWFRQTTDRGLESAAYRKVQDDAVSDMASMKASMRLPGMSRESTMEVEKEPSPVPESSRSSSPSREGSLRGRTVWNQGQFNAPSMPSGTLGSPLPTLSSQRLEPPSSDVTSSHGDDSIFARALAMSPSQGRISPERVERPSSPTKGLGGFVQSAMLKRSDSVNKRWSAQVGPGLSRGNSIASNRSGYDGSRHAVSNMSPPRETKDGNPSREHSPVSTSRPSSSHSNATITGINGSTKRLTVHEGSMVSLMDGEDMDGPRKPLLTGRSRAQSRNDDKSSTNSPEDTDKSPPPSPSKQNDSKRWSPTKASWLESAINKPDSPKPRSAIPPQPSWMADINKAKQQRGSVDLGKSTGFKEVTTGGLLRSPPMGGATKPPTMNGLSGSFTQDLSKRNKVEEPASLTRPGSLAGLERPNAIKVVNAKPPLAPKPQQTEPITEPVSHTKTEPQSKPSTQKLDSPSNVEQQKSSLSSKPKPDTPPKKDFRSNLKSRRVSGGSTKNDEPEFRNVFGKLKRAQTQNYVAPDELKDNILRGKAGLATTGGPKKTERRDEFKESILKKKEEMKGGPPTVGRKTSGIGPEKSHGPSTPEAVSKLRGPSKPGVIASTPDVLKDFESKNLGASSRPGIEEEKTQHMPLDKQPSAPGRLQRESVASGKLADRFNPSLAGLLSRSSSPMTGSTGPVRIKSPNTLEHDSDPPSTSMHDHSNSGQLTHMTKARARGPKRRLPASSKTETLPDMSAKNEEERSASQTFNVANVGRTITHQLPSPSNKSDSRPLANITNGNDKMTYTKPNSKPNTPIKPATLEDLKQSSPHSPMTPKQLPPSKKSSSLSLKEAPSLSPKNPRVRKPSTHITRPLPNVPTSSSSGETKEPPPSVPVAVAETSATGLESAEQGDSPVSVVDAAARWGVSREIISQQPKKSKPQIQLPTKKDEEVATRFAGLQDRNFQEPVGLGIQSLPEQVQKPIPLQHGLPSPPMKSPKPSPMRPPKPESISNRIVSSGSATLAPSLTKESPIPKTSEAIRLFTDFFDEVPTRKGGIDIDTQAVINSRYSPNNSEKIKTLRKQIWEVNGGGKKISVPSHQEHILYEDKMYLCTHVFGSSNGTRTTEVYLWAGDSVSPSALEDAQLFSRRAAKEIGGRLIILKQGKETSNFFQALGGIVITRRGSNSTYMLCGRRHVGQIAFDEVPFRSSSLCSGFPYIISARFGKLYLWKGKGSGADELGCARLIGMDLGLTGEIDEVDDGNEPQEFWESIPGNMVVDIGSHWHLKPSCEGYMTRLFRVELETRPKSNSGFMWGRRGSTPISQNWDERTTASIKEVVPFSRQDLDPEGVFLLDTFFEIYVFVFLFLLLSSLLLFILTIADTLIVLVVSLAPTQPPSSQPFKQPFCSHKNTASSPPRWKIDLLFQ